MERATRTITLPSGTKVQVKEYINARERNELRGIYLRCFSFKPDEQQKPEFSSISGEITDEVEKKLIEVGVVSYNEKTDSIIESILDGSPEDYDALLKELNKLSTGGFQKAN